MQVSNGVEQCPRAPEDIRFGCYGNAPGRSIERENVGWVLCMSCVAGRLMETSSHSAAEIRIELDAPTRESGSGDVSFRIIVALRLVLLRIPEASRGDSGERAGATKGLVWD